MIRHCIHVNIFLLLPTASLSLHIIKRTKKMSDYTRRDSMSGLVLELCLPTFDTVVHDSPVLFAKQCHSVLGRVTKLYNRF